MNKWYTLSFFLFFIPFFTHSCEETIPGRLIGLIYDETKKNPISKGFETNRILIVATPLIRVKPLPIYQRCEINHSPNAHAFKPGVSATINTIFVTRKLWGLKFTDKTVPLLLPEDIKTPAYIVILPVFSKQNTIFRPVY